MGALGVLIRQYCAPAYERAKDRLTDIISTEDTRKHTSDIAELLRQDCKKLEKYKEQTKKQPKKVREKKKVRER